MSVAIKFCGLTRPEDAALAGELGASYVGAIFAGGPRLVTAQRAREVFAGVRPGVARVAVFGSQTIPEIRGTALAAGVDVLQLHADPTPEMVEAVRRDAGLEVWAALRLDDGTLPHIASALLACADALVLDARVPGQLGGTGRTLDWEQLGDALVGRSSAARLVLAGGLTPDNVGAAVAAMRPDVVDVSSGVERAPGVKDHARMRAFAEAVRAAERETARR